MPCGLLDETAAHAVHHQRVLLACCERRLKTDNKRRRHSAAAPHARMKTGIREAFNPTLNGTLIQGTA